MRSDIRATIFASSPERYSAQPEYLLLNILVAGCRPFLLALVYHPQKLGFLSVFQADFERLLTSFPIAVIIGDFNIDLNCPSHDADLYSIFA